MSGGVVRLSQSSEPSNVPDDLDLQVTNVVVDPPVPGRVLAERYEIKQKLGAGGMGEVWMAQDRELDMPVALKVLPPQLSQDSGSIKRLRREATIALKLTHKNICRLYNFQADGQLRFLVMELVEGQTLEQLIEDRGRFNWVEIKQLVHEIGEALHYAHSLEPSVLHMDIKPANIMIDQQGQAKLMDFGIAREIRTSMVRITGEDIRSGTVPYMSPEQFRGDEGVDGRSDLYSFACVIYELLVGEPFVKPSGNMSWQVLERPFDARTDIPQEANLLLSKLLIKSFADRPTSVAEVFDDGAPKDKPLKSPGQKIHVANKPATTSSEAKQTNWQTLAYQKVDGATSRPSGYMGGVIGSCILGGMQIILFVMSGEVRTDTVLVFGFLCGIVSVFLMRRQVASHRWLRRQALDRIGALQTEEGSQLLRTLSDERTLGRQRSVLWLLGPGLAAWIALLVSSYGLLGFYFFLASGFAVIAILIFQWVRFFLVLHQHYREESLVAAFVTGDEDFFHRAMAGSRPEMNALWWVTTILGYLFFPFVAPFSMPLRLRRHYRWEKDLGIEQLLSESENRSL